MIQTRIWIDAARPKTLWAAISPVMVGIAIAWSNDVSHALSAALALAGAVLIQIATNFHNDVADFEKGADSAARLGPVRAVQSGGITATAMRRATFLVFSLAVLSGVYLMMRGGLEIVVIGISSILFALLYTGGKYSLAYLGISDFVVLAFFGPVAVAGTYYVQALSWPAFVWVAGLGPGLLSVTILLVNNIRDIREDELAGKKTIVVRFGRSFGIKAFETCTVLALFLPVLLWRLFGAPPWILLTLLSLPLFLKAARLLKTIPENEGSRLNGVLAMTARNLLVYSILYSLGWIISA